MRNTGLKCGGVLNHYLDPEFFNLSFIIEWQPLLVFSRVIPQYTNVAFIKMLYDNMSFGG